MKSIIKIAIVTLCYITLTFTTNAQKQKFVRASTNVNTMATQPGRGINVGDLVTQGPKQDPTNAKFTGKIRIESDSLFQITDNDIYNSYIVYLFQVERNASTPSTPGGLVPLEYTFYQQSVMHWHKNVVVTKINDREYNYTIYNVPLNKGMVVAFHYKDPSGARADALGGYMCKMKVTNAFTDEQIYRGNNRINATPNYQATMAGQVLTLPTIVISNPSQVIIPN
jgi:hypothetical protein